MFRIKTRKKYFIPFEEYVLIKQSFGAMPCANELKMGMNAYPVLSLALTWPSRKYFQQKSLCWVVPQGLHHLPAYSLCSVWSHVPVRCSFRLRSPLEHCLSPSMAECLSNSGSSVDRNSVCPLCAAVMKSSDIHAAVLCVFQGLSKRSLQQRRPRWCQCPPHEGRDHIFPGKGTLHRPPREGVLCPHVRLLH